MDKDNRISIDSPINKKIDEYFDKLIPILVEFGTHFEKNYGNKYEYLAQETLIRRISVGFFHRKFINENKNTKEKEVEIDKFLSELDSLLKNSCK